MSKKIVQFKFHPYNPNMARTKTCPRGPTPDPTPQPPPPRSPCSSPDYGDLDETTLLASIPTSSVTLKSLPPAKKPRAAAVVAAAAISDELAEEKQKDPVKRH